MEPAASLLLIADKTIEAVTTGLRTIADAVPGEAPTDDEYDDMEGAYGSGVAIGDYEAKVQAATLAREALGLLGVALPESAAQVADIRKIALVVIRAGRLMVVRKRGNDVFILPGGKPEPGEDTDFETLDREVREELGRDLVPSSLGYLGTYRSAAAYDPGRMVTVAAYRGEVDGDPVPTSEIEEVAWFDPRTDDEGRLAATIREWLVPMMRAGRVR